MLRVSPVPVLLALTVLAACEKAPAPKPDDAPPKAAETAPAASASIASASATPVASAAPVASAVASAAPVASAAASGTAGKGSAAVAPPKGGAAKPAAARVAGKNFDLDVASPGCKAGEECAMTIKLLPSGAFHVNKEYPYKFVAAPATGVTYLGKSDPNTFTRAAGDFVEQGEKAATMSVRFKPAAAGDTHVAGKYKLSVCSAEQCQIEEATIDLPVSVL